MENIKSARIWPLLLILFWLIIILYEVLVPSHGGLFIGMHELGLIIVSIWVILSLLIYAILSYFLIWKVKKVIKFRIFFVTGLISLLLTAVLSFLVPGIFLGPFFTVLEAIWP